MNTPLPHLDHRLLLPLLARLPERAAFRAARWRGRWLFRLRRAWRRPAVASLCTALAPLDRAAARRLALDCCQELSADEMETLRMARDPAFLRRHVSLSGLDVLRSARGAPGGGLLLLTHWAGASAVLAALGQEGIPLHIVGRPLERTEDPMHPAHRRFGTGRIRALERAAGHPVVYTGQGNFSRLAGLLRAGGIVALMFDVTPHILHHVAPVEFFGRTAWFGTGMLRLRQESGARLFLASVSRISPTDRRHAHVEEVAVPGGGQDRLLQALVGRLEEQIRRHPQEWLLWDSLSWFFRAPAGDDPLAARPFPPGPAPVQGDPGR